MIMCVVAAEANTKQTFRLPSDGDLIGIWWFLASTSDKRMDQMSL